MRRIVIAMFSYSMLCGSMVCYGYDFLQESIPLVDSCGLRPLLNQLRFEIKPGLIKSLSMTGVTNKSILMPMTINM